MQLLIAISILVGSAILAVFELLVIPFMVFVATSFVVTALIEWQGEPNEKTDFRVARLDRLDDDSVYWDTIADAVSDGDTDAPYTDEPAVDVGLSTAIGHSN